MGCLSIVVVENKGKGRGRLWAIVQEHIDGELYPPSRRQVAKQMGVAPQTLSNWYNGLSSVPQREHLMALAELTGKPYRAVLRAALIDAGLLEEREGSAALRDVDSA